MKPTPQRLTLTFDQITNWLVMNSPVRPTAEEVESAIESLVEQGIIETLWDADGVVSYRLTRDGIDYATNLFQQEDW